MRASLLSAVAWLAFAGPASAVTIDWVAVGNPGNAPDSAANCLESPSDCGAVAVPYRISRYEVTNAQYAEFLNTKAAGDPLGLYHPSMGTSELFGGITRSGSPGSHVYAVKPGFENKPVLFVSFYDALRFTNWLGNGQGDGDTETGVYTLLGGTPIPSNGTTVARNSGARLFLPSENEWYKAAYYDGLSASWFDYPAGSNAQTICATPTTAANQANCALAVPGLTDAGAYSGSASPYGTSDQGGNVFEWVEAAIEEGAFRGVRGGAWFSPPDNLGAAFRIGSNPAGETEAIGFRVAALAPEPHTSALLAAGLAALATRGRLRRR